MTTLPRESLCTLRVIRTRAERKDSSNQAAGRSYLLSYLWAYEDLGYTEQAAELERIYDALRESDLQPLQTVINELQSQPK